MDGKGVPPDDIIELDEGELVEIFVSGVIQKARAELEIERRKSRLQKKGLSVKDRIALFQSDIPERDHKDVSPQSETKNQENPSRYKKFRGGSAVQKENEIDFNTKREGDRKALFGSGSAADKDIYFDAENESGEEIKNNPEEKMGGETSGDRKMVLVGSAEKKNKVDRQNGEEKPEIGVQRHPLIDTEGNSETEQRTKLKAQPKEGEIQHEIKQKEVNEVEKETSRKHSENQIEQEEAKNSSNKVIEEDKEILNEIIEDELVDGVHEVMSAMAEMTNYKRSKDTLGNSSCIELSSSCEAELERILIEPALHEFGPDLNICPKSAIELQADSLIRTAILSGELNFSAHNTGEGENEIEDNNPTNQTAGETAKTKVENNMEESNSPDQIKDESAETKDKNEIEANNSPVPSTTDASKSKDEIKTEENNVKDQTTDEAPQPPPPPPPPVPSNQTTEKITEIKDENKKEEENSKDQTKDEVPPPPPTNQNAEKITETKDENRKEEETSKDQSKDEVPSPPPPPPPPPPTPPKNQTTEKAPETKDENKKEDQTTGYWSHAPPPTLPKSTNHSAEKTVKIKDEKKNEDDNSKDQTTNEGPELKKTPPPTLPKPKTNTARRMTIYSDVSDESSDPGTFYPVKLLSLIFFSIGSVFLGDICREGS